MSYPYGGYGGYGNGHNGHYGNHGYGSGYGYGYHEHNEGALSQAQYLKAQHYAQPGNTLYMALNQPVYTRVDEAVRDRGIQETLRKNYNFIDNSTSGNSAFRDNCYVMHNPVNSTHNYFNEPARKNNF